MVDHIKDNRRINFTIVENELLESPNLSTYEKLTYITLCKFANQENNCFPSRKKLSELVSCSVRTIDRTINSLIQKKLITKTKRMNNKGEYTSNLYTIQGFQGFQQKKGVATHSRQGSDSQSPPGDSQSPELYSFNNIKTEEEDLQIKIPAKIKNKFQQIFNRNLSREFYNEMTKFYSDQKILFQTLKYAEEKADKPAYVLHILSDWRGKGLTSLSDIQNYVKKRNSQNTKNSNKARNNKKDEDKKYKWSNFFIDYEQYKES